MNAINFATFIRHYLDLHTFRIRTIPQLFNKHFFSLSLQPYRHLYRNSFGNITQFHQGIILIIHQVSSNVGSYFASRHTLKSYLNNGHALLRSHQYLEHLIQMDVYKCPPCIIAFFLFFFKSDIVFHK